MGSVVLHPRGPFSLASSAAFLGGFTPAAGSAESAGDRLFFAFPQELPCEIFPPGTGQIVADGYGAQMLCDAPEHRLPAATRKSMLLRFAQTAALRLTRLADPQGQFEEF